MTTLTQETASVALSTERIMTEPELERWFMQNLSKLRDADCTMYTMEMTARQSFELTFNEEAASAAHKKCVIKRAEFARLHLPIAPDAHLRLRVVAKVILSDPSRFRMGNWHSTVYDDAGHACGTAHCIAGWAQELGGKAAYDMTKVYGFLHEPVGAALLGPDAMEHFYDTDEEALEYLRGLED